jgi:hypothetical protein
MDQELENLIWQRAGSRCEYCRFPAEHSFYPFQIDHIIAIKHDGPTVAENLALACYYSNSFKGPNIAGVDPVSRQIVPLYHPRQQVWSEHFAWNGPVLVGLTPSGRTTVRVLRINHPDAVAVRTLLIESGKSLPES